MKTIVFALAGLISTTLFSGEAAAWGSANRFGGSTEHVAGVGTEHTNAWGGSSAHAFGGGSEHTNVYGGTTAGRYGEGAYHTTPSGATAYRPPDSSYPYHPPVAVPYYSASGCYGCAAAAGAVVGVAAGAAVASSSAYSSGYAAGSANTAAAYAMGVNYAALPAGAVAVPKYGTTYYLLGNTWFLPAYGANGVYYRVVPTP